MKKLLLIAAIIVIAAPANAQLFMAWNACDGTLGSSKANLTFDCTPGSGFIADLWGTFGLPGATPLVVAIDGSIDFTFYGALDTPPFWHYEIGGCNNTGIGYSFARGTTETSCASPMNSELFCGSTGSECSGSVTAYINGSQVPLGGPNRARLLFTNARPVTSPVTLPGMPTRVFCFHITLATDNTPGSVVRTAPAARRPRRLRGTRRSCTTIQRRPAAKALRLSSTTKRRDTGARFRLTAIRPVSRQRAGAS
jgi:hypothetical protein